MAKMENSNPKTQSGGYYRLLGHKEFANLFTKAQSTVISNGTELEHIIEDKSKLIEDLNTFIEDFKVHKVNDGSYLCSKRTVKKSKYKLVGHEPDFLIFIVSNKSEECFVIELKDGDNFDTKKSMAEKDALEKYAKHLQSLIPFIVKYYICCFNQESKENIVIGFKKNFSLDKVLTGKELCDYLNISYEDILFQRNKDTEDNLNYVVKTVSNIKEVKNACLDAQRNHIHKQDFYKDDE